MGTLDKLHHTITILITSLSLAACGVPSTDTGTSPPDPGTTNTTDDGGAPAGFCSGDASKFEWKGGLVDPVEITSSRLAQTASSDGAILRFYVERESGMRPSLMFRRATNPSIAGKFDLGSRTSGIDAILYLGSTPVNAVFSGTAQFESNIRQPGPVTARVCTTIFAPGSPLDGARVYVPSFPIMPWSWDDRLTIKLLANHNLNAAEAHAIPFAELATDSNPLIHVSSYSSFEETSHTAHWDAWSLADFVRSRVGVVGPMGVPFVMEADGVPIYLGAFYGSASARTFAGPTIDLDKMNNDGFRIEMNPDAIAPGHADPRDDARILKVLRESGKLLP